MVNGNVSGPIGVGNTLNALTRILSDGLRNSDDNNFVDRNLPLLKDTALASIYMVSVNDYNQMLASRKKKGIDDVLIHYNPREYVEYLFISTILVSLANGEGIIYRATGQTAELPRKILLSNLANQRDKFKGSLEIYREALVKLGNKKILERMKDRLPGSRIPPQELLRHDILCLLGYNGTRLRVRPLHTTVATPTVATTGDEATNGKSSKEDYTSPAAATEANINSDFGGGLSKRRSTQKRSRNQRRTKKVGKKHRMRRSRKHARGRTHARIA